MNQVHQTVSFLGRTVWGRMAFSLQALQEHRDAILQQAAELKRQGGGLVVIAHAEDQEPSVLLLLTLLFGKLKKRGEPVRLYRPRLEPDLPPDLHGYVLVHQLPQWPGLLDLLEAGRTPGVIIATGTRSEWASLSLRLPHRFYPLPEGEGDEGALDRAVQTEWEQYQGLGEDARLYRLVALFDAWGIPLPFSLLARALRANEDKVGDLVEEAHDRGLLFWIELEKPPALLVSTKDPRVARKMIEAIRSGGRAEAEVLEEYATVIQAVDPEEKEERYTVLKLLQAFLRGSHRWEAVQRWGVQQSRRAWLQELIRRAGPRLDQIWQRGDATEHLLWGKLFEELRDFQRSEQIFQQGLARWPENPYLLHGRAKMRGEWARLNPSRLADAEEAFHEAARRMPDNPYVWQAWGVMAAELEMYSDARRYFGLALQAAQASRRERDAIYTLIAWADLEIEAGQYSEADRLLQEVERLDPQNPYGLHLQGKKAFYQGKYSEAEEAFRQVLRIDPANVAALHSLGNMALKRGQWTEAERFLRQALTLHPDNIPTLHALGELWAERGDWAAEEGKPQEAIDGYRRAEAQFRQILDWEPNLPARVALGRLLTRWASLDPHQAAEAELQLQEALRLHPTNRFALHALGELRRQQGKFPEAEAFFQEVLRQDPANLPALLSLADLYLMQDRQPEAQQLLDRVRQYTEAIQRGDRPCPVHELIRTYNTWAHLELRAGRKDQARSLVEQALGRDPLNAYTLRLQQTLMQN
jgi:tetratricopeptide (TPR) repeat protein